MIIRWSGYQINRNSLFTNYRVTKFKPNISPLCSLCLANENFPRFELISHLFYDCDFVLNMWQSIKTWLATLDIILPLDRAKLLFGIHNEQCNSTLNYIILCAKNCIWKAKFTTKDVSLENFQKYLYYKLTDKKKCLRNNGKRIPFWKLD